MEIKYILIPFLGGIIGWITNVLAIKLIFRPHKPINVMGYVIQGIIPKRRYEISANIARTIEQELLSMNDLLPFFEKGMSDPSFIRNISDVVKKELINRVPAFIPSKLREITSELIETILLKELPKVLPSLAKNGLENLGDNIKISSIIEEKINNLELIEFENMVISITKKELKHIEYLGAVLGFLIGLIQLLIVTYIL